jgi:hypothetical protein
MTRPESGVNRRPFRRRTAPRLSFARVSHARLNVSARGIRLTARFRHAAETEKHRVFLFNRFAWPHADFEY